MIRYPPHDDKTSKEVLVRYESAFLCLLDGKMLTDCMANDGEVSSMVVVASDLIMHHPNRVRKNECGEKVLDLHIFHPEFVDDIDKFRMQMVTHWVLSKSNIKRDVIIEVAMCIKFIDVIRILCKVTTGRRCNM